jgi:hypothetical protein
MFDSIAQINQSICVPRCLEAKCRARMNRAVPVCHEDQASRDAAKGRTMTMAPLKVAGFHQVYSSPSNHPSMGVPKSCMAISTVDISA